MVFFFHFWKRNHNSRNYARLNVQIFFLSLFILFFFPNEVTGPGIKYAYVALPFFLLRLPFLCEQSLLCWVRSCLHGCAEGDGWFFRAESAKSLGCVQISARFDNPPFFLDVAQFLQLWNPISLWKKIKSHVESAVNVSISMIWRNRKDLRISDYFSKLEIVLVLRRVAFSLPAVTQGQA